MTGAVISLVLLATAQFYIPGPLSKTQLEGKDRSGAEIFASVCSMCHVDHNPGPALAPEVSELRRLTAEQIKDSLYIGSMENVGNSMTDQEVDNIAAFLTTPAPKPASDAKPATP